MVCATDGGVYFSKGKLILNPLVAHTLAHKKALTFKQCKGFFDNKFIQFNFVYAFLYLLYFLLLAIALLYFFDG